MKSQKPHTSAAVIGGSIMIAGFAVAFGLYVLAEEIKMSGDCPNPWRHRDNGWRCHGERYPESVEREKRWFAWAATEEGKRALELKKRQCGSNSSGLLALGITPPGPQPTKLELAMEKAAEELCREKVAEELAKIRFPE